jgi:GNAT superfamily N-acetyltransferase
VEIRRTGYAHPDAQRLAANLAEELLERHGRPGSGGEPPTSDFDPPEGAFVVGYDVGEPVACGGVCRYDGRTGEIRRMYVVRAARSRGFSRAILAALESAARKLGYEAIRLETGNRQHEAISLYRSSGYEPIERYGPYVEDERSVCFEKKL